jgi:hypothetical protein
VRNTGDGRTGTFTSGIVSIWREWKVGEITATAVSKQRRGLLPRG